MDAPGLNGRELMALVGVADQDRARTFYLGVLDLPVIEEDPFTLVVDAGGTTLRITTVPAPAPAPYSVLGWTVPDIAATVDNLTARGVHFEFYDTVTQDERGIWTAPDGTQVAWFLDPDGNNLSVVQRG
jgi:catechol 2,3-dioxygenase-like lactoylglutathione lyase family enzyme